MQIFNDDYGGAAYLNITGPTQLTQGHPRVLTVTAIGGSYLALPEPSTLQLGAPIFIIINIGGSLLHVREFAAGSDLFSLVEGESAYLGLKEAGGCAIPSAQWVVLRKKFVNSVFSASSAPTRTGDLCQDVEDPGSSGASSGVSDPSESGSSGSPSSGSGGSNAGEWLYAGRCETAAVVRWYRSVTDVLSHDPNFIFKARRTPAADPSDIKCHYFLDPRIYSGITHVDPPFSPEAAELTEADVLGYYETCEECLASLGSGGSSGPSSGASSGASSGGSGGSSGASSGPASSGPGSSGPASSGPASSGPASSGPSSGGGFETCCCNGGSYNGKCKYRFDCVAGGGTCWPYDGCEAVVGGIGLSCGMLEI